MAQYIAFFERYMDLAAFDGNNERCVFVGPITTLTVSGTFYLSPYGIHTEEVVSEVVTTNYVPTKYRIGNEQFSSCMLFSEDIPGMKKIISFAQNGSRLLSYGEYGFLNHVKYAAVNATIGIMVPNTKKVEAYLIEKCPAKGRQNINPTHPVIVIFKMFDHFKKSYVFLAHSSPAQEIGQEMIEYQDAWFNYITEKQKLFKDDNITEIVHDAVFALDQIGYTL